MFYSPLEKFDLINLVKIGKPGFIDLSITNSFIFIFLSVFFIIFIFKFSTYNYKLLPSYWQIFCEVCYNFLLNLVYSQSGKKGVLYFPFIFTLFFVILTMNYFGLFPFGFTVTSHIAITFFISFSIWFTALFLGFFEQGLKFLKIFIPRVPFYLLPLLIIVEIVSYLIRAFSLAIRLSANMTAGHTLVHIIAGFSVQLHKFNFLSFFLPFLLVLGILALEFGIAFLQAYVFVTLTSIYFNDSLNLNSH